MKRNCRLPFVAALSPMIIFVATGCATKQDLETSESKLKAEFGDRANTQAQEIERLTSELTTLKVGLSAQNKEAGRLEEQLTVANKRADDLERAISRLTVAAKLVDLRPQLRGDWELSGSGREEFLARLLHAHAETRESLKNEVRVECPFESNDSTVSCKTGAIVFQIGRESYDLTLKSAGQEARWNKFDFLSSPVRMTAQLRPHGGDASGAAASSAAGSAGVEILVKPVTESGELEFEIQFVEDPATPITLRRVADAAAG